MATASRPSATFPPYLSRLPEGIPGDPPFSLLFPCRERAGKGRGFFLP